ncbi:hypothetical protein ATCC90586_005765 [Pythium insidiosum]|nr:hypothetical protein ATCC90586_005765 [Pythium insidiosum]
MSNSSLVKDASADASDASAAPGGAATPYQMQLPLSPNLMRNLGDRSYDKRKSAAMELENLIKQLQESASAMEMMPSGAAASGAPLPPALAMAAASRHRIGAIIELLGNDFACSTNANHRKGGLIGLAATAIGLMHDAHMFLDKLLPPVLHCFDDPESRVRYYACESLYNIAKVARGHILHYFNQIFDGLCKLFADVDVDVKNGANLLDRLVKDIVTESEYFDVDMFIPLLHKYIRMTNPYIRQLLVGWITVLDSVPDIDMLDWLPEFLDGLFNMLSDGNREIRQAADSALAEFLREIKQTEHVDYGRMVDILVGQCNSKERFNRLTAITWVHEFVMLGKERLVAFYAQLLAAIMHCISDAEHEIRQVAERANDDLLQLVRTTEDAVDLVPLMAKLNAELVSDHVPTRMAALRWISMLLEKAPHQLSSHINTLLPTLLRTLSDVSDAVVLLDLEVLARISLNQTEFEKVLNQIVLLFAQDRRLLETRGSLIVRKLCVLLDATSIYMIFAKVLAMAAMPESQQKELLHMDGEFASVMVQTLNLILLTAHELENLRDTLRRSFQPHATDEDVQVFKVDKLVQLLESPIFIHMRLQLLEIQADYHADLVKSLYGLLMLLPQSAAFRILRDRLASVTNMATAIGRITLHDGAAPRAPTKKEKGRPDTDTGALLQHFNAVQKRHADAKKKVLNDKSLLKDSSQ